MNCPSCYFYFILLFFSCLYRLPASGSNSIRLHPLQTYLPTLQRLQLLQLSHRHAFIYRNRVQISPDLPSPIIPDLLTPPGLGRSSCYLTAHTCGGGRHSNRADSPFCCDNGKNEAYFSSDSTSKLCLRPVGPVKT